jgi:hypothetical protein
MSCDTPFLCPETRYCLAHQTKGCVVSHRLVATRANGRPAFGVYVSDPLAPVFHANGLMVVTLAGSRASALTRFDNSNLSRFGLPRTLPA